MSKVSGPGGGVVVDFKDVSTEGLESSPHAEALAGLRANEARYFKDKYDHTFTGAPGQRGGRRDRVGPRHPRGRARDRVASSPLQATLCDVPGIAWAHVFYESGLAVNVLYGTDEGGKRAVGFKLSEGMEPPEELSAFNWARQKSKLAGTIRGSYFVIKQQHEPPARWLA